ncbi:hypothetical protein DSCOOX_07280 [Desulfosarcina ovata subsp. ovata]|uniref:Cadherin domain-containing protein n=2 Tax=Desulfosarcina ovata TaxID=83564 RepID=A0A5K8A5B3_9BACT|nr:hypothetical protein DSCOOX_07280 [Desulfosarcina ovata subsp. ovata]
MPEAEGGIGVVPYNTYYYDLSTKIPAEGLAPSASITFGIKMVSRTTFTYNVTVYGVIPVVNQAPGFSPIDLQAVAEGQPLSFLVTAIDPDEGDTITLDGQNLPIGAEFDASTGSFFWTPNFDQAGTYTVTFTAEDAGGLTASMDVPITVTDTNRSPAFTSSPITDATQSEPYAYTATATDADGDAVTFTFVQAPMGMTIDPNTGAIAWTPAETGDVTVEIQAADSSGGSAVQSFTIAVASGTQGPLALSITSPAEGHITNASPITVQGTVSDTNALVVVQNVVADVVGTTFQAERIPLVEGLNTIEASAHNDADENVVVTSSVILDTTPPSFIITSPSERSLYTNPLVTIYGIVSDATNVTATIDGNPATVEEGNLTANKALSPGRNVVSIICQDAAGNTTKKQLTLFLDTAPLSVIAVDPPYGTPDVPTTTAITLTFSEPVNPESLRSSAIFISDGSGSILPAEVIVSSDASSATLTPTAALPAGTSINVSLTTGVTDVAGNPLSAPFTSVFVTAGEVIGPGVVIGEVYDDTKSLPLSEASVAAISSETGDVITQTQTDELGRYLLETGTSEIWVRVSKPGFTVVDRQIGSTQNSYAEALDARLTPVSQAVPVIATVGAEARNLAGDVLTIQPGAFDADGEITFTVISPQGPQVPFPYGWSPVAIVQIDSPAVFDPPAVLEVTDQTGAAAGKDAVFAYYDEATRQWIALETVVIPADGPATFQAVIRPGQFALLLSDAGEGGPSAVVLNEALASGEPIEIPLDAEATGIVTPPAGRADDPTPANALVTIHSDIPLRSGTPLRGDFLELFVLRDGDRISPMDNAQDLFAYRALEDAEGQTLTAGFPMVPSETFALGEISEGTITVSLNRSSQVSRSLVGSDGGGLQTEDGSRVVVPSGAFTVDVPVDLKRLDEEIYGALTPEGFTYLGGLGLDLAGQTAAVPLSLTLGDTAWRVPTGSQVVVAQVRTVQGRERLVLVGLARIEGNDLTMVTQADGTVFPGVREGGVYCFYRYDGELAVFSGTAREEAGRRDGLVTHVEAMPFVSVTDTNGRFSLVSQPGSYVLVAEAVSTHDKARVQGETGVPLSEVIIHPNPPSVERIVVRSPLVAGNYAGPVVLLGKPAPLVDDDTTGESSGNGNGWMDGGERIELYLSVRNEGTIAVENISFALRIDTLDGDIAVLPEIVTIDSLPPDEALDIGPFVFDVPANMDGSELRFTLSSLSDQGIANRTAFHLPLEVEHIDVPIGSEVLVYFSEAVDAQSLPNALTLEKENGSSLTPIATKLVVAGEGEIAKLRPIETLEDDTVYRITLSQAIVDTDNYPLAEAPVVERFKTVDLTPPGPIDPGSIEVGFPDEEGFVSISGSIGSVNPDDTVIVLNETTGFTALAIVSADGSFNARVYAELTDQITLRVQDRNGNEIIIDPGPFVQRDPITGEVLSTMVGRRGGTVPGPDGIQMIVPAGSLIDATELRLSRDKDPFSLPSDIASKPTLVSAFESFFDVVDRIRIDGDVRQFIGPVEISLPPPQDAVEGDLFLVVRDRTVTIGGAMADLDLISGLTAVENPLRDVERLAILDTATVKNEGGELVLSTDSPPFQGVTGPGTLTVLKVNGQLTFFAGEVRRDSIDGQPVSDAVVQSIPDAAETAAFVSITDADGEFVVTDSSAGGPYEEGAVVAGRLEVFDPDFLRTIRRDVRGVVGLPAPPETVVAYLEEPFILPAKLPGAIIDILGDLEPPKVKIYVQGDSLQGGYSRAGDSLTVTVVTDDNDEVAFVALEVNQGSGFKSVSLSPAGTYTMTPLSDALLTFRATARDASGNTSSSEANVRAVEAEAGEPLIPQPISGQAAVRIDPPSAPPSDSDGSSDASPDGSGDREISFDGDIVLTYSEPLDPDTVNKDSVQLKDPEGNLVECEILKENNNAVIRIAPNRYLRLGASYTVTLTGLIQDSEGNSIEEETLEYKVPPPVQKATIDLKNTEDVALFGNFLVVANHPDTSTMKDFGAIHTYKIKKEDGQLLSNPDLFSSKQVNGKPVSLAVDCGLLYVGNRFIGLSKLPETEFFFAPTIVENSVQGALAGCLPTGLAADYILGPFNPDWIGVGTDTAGILSALYPDSYVLKNLYNGLSAVGDAMSITAPLSMMEALVSPSVALCLNSVTLSNSPLPSNLAVYDLKDPENPEFLGAGLSNRVSGLFHNPSCLTNKIAVTDQGIGVLNFMDNFELFTATPKPVSQGIFGRLDIPGKWMGRCDGGPNADCSCLSSAYSECKGYPCSGTTEFLDVALFKSFAVVLEKDMVRMVTLDKAGDPRFGERTLGLFPLPGTFVGRIGGVSDFEVISSSGSIELKSLLFVVGQTNNTLTILDVTDPTHPRRLSDLPDTYGNMSFDSCLGLAYIHGRGGEFHIVDFNDPENPRELNNPGNGMPFKVEGLGSGVPINGNKNQDGIVYLGNRPGVRIIQIKNGSNPAVIAKPSSKSACEECVGPNDIKISVKDDKRIVGISDPSDQERDYIEIEISLDETISQGTNVTIKQSGVGKVIFKADLSDEEELESLDLNLSPGSQTIYVFGKSHSMSKDDTKISIQFGENECGACKSIILTVVGIDLDVDSDNNLKIEAKEDEYETEYPGFIFWVNVDKKDDCSMALDSDDYIVNGEKDLEDFATLSIDMSLVPILLGQDSSSWLPDDYTCYLRMEPFPDSEISPPAIRIFKKEDKGLEYLSDKTAAEKQKDAHYPGVLVSYNDGEESKYKIKISDLDDNGRVDFLFEGRLAGRGYLALVLKDSNDRIVSKDKVYINIKPLRHLYTMANARACSCAECDGKHVDWPSGTQGSNDDYGYTFGDDINFNKPNLTVFVHGYNVPICGAFQTFDEVFKRLYWTGVTNPEIERDESGNIKQKGSDFIGLTWEGDEQGFFEINIEIDDNEIDLNNVVHFNRNVSNALQASLSVGEFLKTMAGSKQKMNIMAHSLGNMLVSSAIKRVSGIGADKYILHEAAVPANSYDADYDGYGVAGYQLLLQTASIKGLRSKADERGWANDDPWANYFSVVPDRVEMVNTFSSSDPVLWGWIVNEIINKPDLATHENYIDDVLIALIGSDPRLAGYISYLRDIEVNGPQWSWDDLPESPPLPTTEFSRISDELSYYFQSLSLPAGVTEFPGITGIRSVDVRGLGIDAPGEVHSAFVMKPFSNVWPFWNGVIARELRPAEED